MGTRRRRQTKIPEQPSQVQDMARQVEEAADCACEEQDERVEFLNAGSVMFNLALSQKGVDGGWGRGRIGNLVGDGSSGKTLCALEACADAWYNIRDISSELFPAVKHVKIVYWNREGVMDFPLERMYGQQFVDGVEWSDNCDTAEQWGRDVFRRLDAHKHGEFFLGVLDSVDSLGTEAGEKRLATSVKTDKPIDGSYGTGPERAKYFSGDFFNNLCKKMKGKDFTLLLISQVREKIDTVLFGEKYTRAGGKALDFYTHQVAWLAQYGKLQRQFSGEKRVYGVEIQARIKRNKCAVPYRDARFPIIFDYGIDNIGSCLDYLHGPKDKEIPWGGSRILKSQLIDMADADPEIEAQIVAQAVERWCKVEENTRVVRRPKFGK